MAGECFGMATEAWCLYWKGSIKSMSFTERFFGGMRFSEIIPAVLVALVLVGCHSSPPSRSTTPRGVTDAEHAEWPRTVDEDVTRILAGMKDSEREKLAETRKEDLIAFHHGWGTGIRNEFGLWLGNTNLLADCQAQHPDDAAMVIIEVVWEKLQKP